MINKLLLIDDDELTSYLVKKLIKGICEVNEFVIRENGLEGLDYLSEIGVNKEFFPELIILDIDMPVMNGYEFVEIYEKKYWLKYPETKLLMITSSKRKLDFEKCLSFRCVEDCIYKPLTRTKIEKILSNVFYQDHQVR